MKNPRTAPAVTAADPLTSGPLATRTETAHERLVYQHDPALYQALSERELADERELAERLRDHGRTTTTAAIASAEEAADQVRRAQAAILAADVEDLVLARRALADQRRESSPYAQLAYLYRLRKWSSRGFAAVVVLGMLWSAVNVQHNIAPAGMGDPLYWASYVLEALISLVLVIFMVSSAATARWKVAEGNGLIAATEVFLLAASLLLNTYPYIRAEAWFDAAVHGTAPVMIGVALLGHEAVSRRVGAAIAAASRDIPADDDIAERLTALTSIRQDLALDDADAARVLSSAAPQPTRPVERRASSALDEQAAAGVVERRAGVVERESSSAPLDAVSAAIEAELLRERVEVLAVHAIERRAPSVEQSTAELETERSSSAADAAVDGVSALDETEAVERARRSTVAAVRDVRPVLVERSSSVERRAPVERRASSVEPAPMSGALAHALDEAPRPRSTNARRNGPTGVFADGLTAEEATRLARSVVERGGSRQPVEVLARIYLAHAQGDSANHIGENVVGLPCSTVTRAIKAAHQVTGPRPVR